MAYNIPSKVKALFLLQETKVDLYKIVTQNDLVFKHAQIHLFIRGLIGQDFKMRINVYTDETHQKLLLQSIPVNNLDITRSADLYAELRFDFPNLGNLLGNNKKHMLEFEIYDGYVYDNNNFVAIILEPLATQAFLGSDYYELVDAPKLGAKCSFFFDTKNPHGEQYFMCRINGAKLLNGITTRLEYQTSPSRQWYSTTIQKGLVIDSLKLTHSGGVQTIFQAEEAFTPDPLDLDLNLNFFHYDPVTGELVFYTSHTLAQDTYAILEYAIHMTNMRGRYAKSQIDAGDVVFWEPRLNDNVSFDFSQQNNMQGVLSISSSSITLKNEDGYFSKFFSANDSFSNREIKCWRFTGSSSTVEFVGTIRGASYNDDDCSFSIADPLAMLDDEYYDYRPKTVQQLADAAGYSVRLADIHISVPRVLGKISSFSYLTRYTGQKNDINRFSTERAIKCIDVSFNNIPTTSNNRTWSCGFGPASAATQQRDVTAVANYVDGTFSATKFTIDNTNGPVSEWLPPGTCIVNNGRYGIVSSSNDTEAYIWPHDAGFSASADIIRHKVISVIIDRNGTYYYPLAGRDYTCQIGVAGDLQIVFNNNFEATLGLTDLPYINPVADEQIFAVFMNDEADAKASTIVRDTLLMMPISVSGLFLPDQTPPWIDPELAITLPVPGESGFPSFRTVIELALKSSMSCLYFDNQGHIRYKSFMQAIQSNPEDIDNQSGLDPENAITQKNSNGFSVSLDMWDLYSGAEFDFSHCRMSATYINSYNIARDFYRSGKLYQTETVIDPTRKATASFLEEYTETVMGRSAKFTLTALAEHMGLYIGDDIVVKRNNLIAGETQATLRVVSLNKSLSSVKMDFVDLKKFPTL
jgi:hypothetical protein